MIYKEKKCSLLVFSEGTEGTTMIYKEKFFPSWFFAGIQSTGYQVGYHENRCFWTVRKDWYAWKPPFQAAYLVHGKTIHVGGHHAYGLALLAPCTAMGSSQNSENKAR